MASIVLSGKKELDIYINPPNGSACCARSPSRAHP